MAQPLSPEVTNLAKAIQAASLEERPKMYQGLDLSWACKHVEQTVTESFIPNLIDPLDRSIYSRSEVRWLASVEAAQEMLEAEAEGTERKESTR